MDKAFIFQRAIFDFGEPCPLMCGMCPFGFDISPTQTCPNCNILTQNPYHQVRLPIHASILLPTNRTLQAGEARAAAAVAARADPVAGVLLLRRHQEPQLRPHGGQPDMCADPLGEEPGGAR